MSVWNVGRLAAVGEESVRDRENIHGGDIYRNPVRLDFSVNTSPLGMPEETREALLHSVEDCGHYPDLYADRLRRAVARQLGVRENWLLFGNGASELFMGIVHALRPEKVLLPVPSFYGYRYAAEAACGSISKVYLQEQEDFVPGDELIKCLTEDVDLVFLSNPNNPTGRCMEPEYLTEVLRLCREKQIYVVLDECFLDFCIGRESVVPQIEQYNRLLVVRAFTKLYAIPGVRLGYLVCSNEALLEKVRRHLPEWNVSVPAQAAGLGCLEQENYVQETRAYVARERAYLSDCLKRAGIRVFESEADFLLIYSRIPLYTMLLEKGILIRDCSNFEGLSEGYYRVAVRSHEENEELGKAVGECVL